MHDDPPQLVNELIDNYNMGWDIEKLQKFFLPMDKEAILSIPLTIRRQDDFWTWHHVMTVILSVRLAYHMLVDTRGRMTTWLDERAGSSRVGFARFVGTRICGGIHF
jgi:hypothetical protein